MSLKTTVEGLVITSEVLGKEREHRLERGLIIAVFVNRTVTRLRLKRFGIVPGRLEWNTVIDVWPYPVGVIVPEAAEENGFLMLQGSWPTPARLIDV